MIKIYKNVNRNKLHTELQNAEIETEYVLAIDNTDIGCKIKFKENTNMELVQQIIDAHEPSPIPPQPTKEEVLEQKLQSQEVAIAELTLLLSMMMGGM